MKIVLEQRYEKSVGLEPLLCSLRDVAGVEVAFGCDLGHLKADEQSPYAYYIAGENQYLHQEKTLFYNNLELPEWWEVRPDGAYGAIYFEGVKQGTIRFIHPEQQRLVRCVEWETSSGKVYKTDHYDKYGKKYSSEYFGDEGELESRVFYSDTNQEVVVELPQNEVFFLMKNGKLIQSFSSYAAFVQKYLDEAGIQLGR